MIVFFIFSNSGQGLQRKFTFSDEFVHVNVITFDGETWIFHEYGSRGFECRVLRVKDSATLFRNLKRIDHITSIITLNVQREKCYKFRFLMPQACNNIMTQISGINIGYTINPAHLYKKLLKNKPTNFEILSTWRRKTCLTQTSVMTRLIINCNKVMRKLSVNVSNFLMSESISLNHKIENSAYRQKQTLIRMKFYDNIT